MASGVWMTAARISGPIIKADIDSRTSMCLPHSRCGSDAAYRIGPVSVRVHGRRVSRLRVGGGLLDDGGNHGDSATAGAPSLTRRKPRWFVPVEGSPLPRVPTMYREQYCSVQRKEPPRCTRLATPGSLGSSE